MPFSIIAFNPCAIAYYYNEDLDAHWREVRRASRSWRQRDKLMTELAANAVANSEVTAWSKVRP